LNAIIPASSNQSKVPYDSLPQLKAELQQLQELKDFFIELLKQLKELSENDDPSN
jgi:hypothetical protein